MGITSAFAGHCRRALAEKGRQPGEQLWLRLFTGLPWQGPEPSTAHCREDTSFGSPMHKQHTV